MATNSLDQYIASQRAAGFSNEELRPVLLQAGWSPTAVDKALPMVEARLVTPRQASFSWGYLGLGPIYALAHRAGAWFTIYPVLAVGLVVAATYPLRMLAPAKYDWLIAIGQVVLVVGSWAVGAAKVQLVVKHDDEEGFRKQQHVWNEWGVVVLAAWAAVVVGWAFRQF